MAIVIPGKRPSERVATSRVLGKRMSKGKKSGYAGLMLTSLVDMFTIIVIFLLQQFSASGEILYLTKDIKLPNAAHGAEVERAPVVSLSPESITVDGRQIALTVDVAGAELMNIPELEDALRDEKRRFDMLHANNPDKPFRGLVNVQADRKIPFKIVKRVMYSCNMAGFGNINFAALSKSTAAEPVTASN